MRYITKNSRRGFVNILAEKISNKLNENEKYSSQIEVVDCVNFMVVKGYSSNRTPLNLTEFKDEFIKDEEKYIDELGIKKLNLIDVIDYKKDLELESSSYWFEFWNSKRPLYNTSVINLLQGKNNNFNSLESVDYTSTLIIECPFPLNYDDLPYANVSSPITISSHFPFGYSLGSGKTKLLYCEHICYQLFSILNTDKIIFKISNRVNENGDLDIVIITNSQYDDDDVKSMVLDIFDFNLTKFQTEYLKSYDFINEITNPFEQKPWLIKNKVKDLLIV